MTLPDIMEDVLHRAGRPLPSGRLTTLVEHHSDWKGKTRGTELEQRIIGEAQGDLQRFTLRRSGRRVYIGLNEGSGGELGKDGQELIEDIAAAAAPKVYAACKIGKAAIKVVKDLGDNPDQ